MGVWLKGSDFLLAAAAVLVPAYLLFRMRMMGAGDGKLMALIAGYLGLEPGIRAIGVGMAIGAVWSMCRIWHDKSLLSRFTYLNAYIGRTILTKEIIPYQRLTSEEPPDSAKGRLNSEEQLFSQKQKIEYGQLSVKESRHTIPLAACLASGTYLYLMFSCAVVVGKEFL